jgi:hypothetical protein
VSLTLWADAWLNGNDNRLATTMADTFMDTPRLAKATLISSKTGDGDVAARIVPIAGMTGLRKEATRGPVDSRGLDRARTAYIRVTC